MTLATDDGGIAFTEQGSFEIEIVVRYNFTNLLPTSHGNKAESSPRMFSGFASVISNQITKEIAKAM